MSDSQATEIIDLLSDGSSEDSSPLIATGSDERANGRGQKRAIGLSQPDLLKPLRSQHSDSGQPSSLKHTNENMSSPLDGLSLIHLSVAADDDAALADTSPDDLQMLLPQLNPPDRCLSLQQLLHPQLLHSHCPERVLALLATTFVGGIPTALQPFVYGAGGAPPRNTDEEQISAPVSPPCPVTFVKHSGDRKGQSSAVVLQVPSTTGHSLHVVQPPLPRSTHYGTAHSKVIAIRWGPGVLFPHGTLRVIVLTANLCEYDLDDCYQCAWAQDFPVLGEPNHPATNLEHDEWVPCACGAVEHRLRIAGGCADHGQYFRNVLVQALKVPEQRVDTLLSNVDWSPCAVDFVATMAGLWAEPQQMLSNGLYRLAAVRAQQRGSANEIVGPRTPPPSASSSGHQGHESSSVQRVWAQVSSLGSILDSSFNLSHLALAANGAIDARKWGKQGPTPAEVSKLVPHCDIMLPKRELCMPGATRSAADLHRLLQLAERCTPPTAAQRRAGSFSDIWRDKASRPPSFTVPVKLYWPSVRFIRGTRHRSVGNVLMQKQHWSSDAFPRAAVHAFELNPAWYSDSAQQRESTAAASAAGGSSNTSRCAPGLASPLSSHTKLLGPQLDVQSESAHFAWHVGAGSARVRLLRDWLYVGSHNLSRSAWGALQKSTAHGGAATMSCNNHEFGVVFRPVFLEQRVSSVCTCTDSGICDAVRRVPAFQFVHDLKAPSLQEQAVEPWTQQQSAADQEAVMLERMARMMAGQ